MMKGFKIDLKGQRQRMKYQEAQRIQSMVVKDPGNQFSIKMPEGQLRSFVSRLIK